MVDTPRTINYLLTSEFQDGQASGSITPQRMRDFIVTMSQRSGGSYGSFVRVTDPEFGADPTGIADSTTAFHNAMVAGPAIVPATQANGSIAQYKVSNCVVPSGAALIGGGGPGYLSLGGDQARPVILPVSSGTVRLFNVDNAGSILFSGLALDGTGTSLGCDGISAGSMNMTVENCMISHCNNGIGGQVTGSTATFPTAAWKLNLYNTNIMYCHNGITDIVDGFLNSLSVNGCDNGVNLTSSFASQTVNFVQCRFEWCGKSTHPNNPYTTAAGYGCVIHGNEIAFIGCKFDANGNAGVQVNGQRITFAGCQFQRNGNNCSSGTTLISTSSHIFLDGATSCLFTGCTTFHYSGGGDGFVNAPAATAYFNGSGTNNVGIVFVGNDLSGCQGNTTGGTFAGPVNSNTLWRNGTVPTGTGLNGYVVKNNLGTGTAAQDIDTR